MASSRAFRYADHTAAYFNSSTIDNEELAKAISRVLQCWRRKATLFDIIGETEKTWSKESVAKLKLDDGIEDLIADAGRLILLAKPDSNISEEDALEGGRKWARNPLKN